MTPTIIEKGWGREIIYASTPDYCGKILQFAFAGSRSSMHFHGNKHETWYVQSGEFVVEWIDTSTSAIHSEILKQNSVWVNAQLSPHRLICTIPGDILEVSTVDTAQDNYRVMPGDSQS